MKFEIIFYDLPNGEMPALEFLLSVNKKLRAKISRDIELFATMGRRSGNHIQNRWVTAYLN